MAKILPENLNVPYCRTCQNPMAVYAFTWGDDGSYHGICFCKRCESLQWRVLTVEDIMKEVIAAKNGKVDTSGVSGGYL